MVNAPGPMLLGKDNFLNLNLTIDFETGVVAADTLQDTLVAERLTTWPSAFVRLVRWLVYKILLRTSAL